MVRTIASTTRSGDVIFGTGFAATALLLAAVRRLRRVVTVSMVLLSGLPTCRTAMVRRGAHADRFGIQPCLSRAAGTINATLGGPLEIRRAEARKRQGATHSAGPSP